MSSEPASRQRFVKKIIGLWLLLRVLTSIVALVPSILLRRISPTTEYSQVEVNVPVWPPSYPILTWIERITVEPWFRWDAKYYIWSVSRGFSIEDGSASFHPLLSVLAKPIFYATGSPLFALLVIATLGTLALYFAFNRLSGLDLSDQVSWRAVLLFALFPASYVLYAPYTESTFLLFSVLLFYFARQQRWLLAGMCGALATLSRQQGLFLIVPLAMELWAAKQRRPIAVCSLIFIPAAYALWIVYRTFALSDSSPNVSSFHGLIYSVLISPSAYRVGAEQDFLLPPHAMYLALAKLWHAPTVPIITDLFFGLVFVVLMAIAWRNMRASYKGYSLILLLVSFSYHTGMHASSAYMGLPRHLLLAFPVFIGLAPRVTEYAASKLFKLGLLGMLILTFFHCLRVWVP